MEEWGGMEVASVKGTGSTDALHAFQTFGIVGHVFIPGAGIPGAKYSKRRQSFATIKRSKDGE